MSNHKPAMHWEIFFFFSSYKKVTLVVLKFHFILASGSGLGFF